MEILGRQPSTKGERDGFTGHAWIDLIVSGEAPSRVWVTVVRFAPGARMAWHAHALGQTLHVTEGLGWMQSRGGEVIEVRAGDTVRTPPGEWHWHGASPDHFMSHLAIWEATPDGSGVDWGDQVTDVEYALQATESHG